MHPTIRIICFAVFICFISACNNAQVAESTTETETPTSKEPLVPSFSSYMAAIEEVRKNKNIAMASNETLEPEKRKDFKGLIYFEPDSSYLFRATLELLNPEKVIFKTTDERAPEYYKFCKFSFKHNNENLTLYGYVENAESPESIFVPFKDATSNKETYGGGRYIDIHYKGEKTMIILDFNTAYNPYCHYNHDYSCPLVPAENILSIPIFAGEKKLYE